MYIFFIPSSEYVSTIFVGVGRVASGKAVKEKSLRLRVSNFSERRYLTLLCCANSTYPPLKKRVGNFWENHFSDCRAGTSQADTGLPYPNLSEKKWGVLERIFPVLGGGIVVDFLEIFPVPTEWVSPRQVLASFERGGRKWVGNFWEIFLLPSGQVPPAPSFGEEGKKFFSTHWRGTGQAGTGLPPPPLVEEELKFFQRLPGR